MGNRFSVMLVALGTVFFAGWMFANEVAPPRMNDISAAVWIVALVVAIVLSSMVSAARG